MQSSNMLACTDLLLWRPTFFAHGILPHQACVTRTTCLCAVVELMLLWHKFAACLLYPECAEVRLQQKANFTPLAGCGAYAASTVPSCKTAFTVLSSQSPFGQPVSHLADDGEAMCQGAHRGDCWATASFIAGLECWPRRWSYNWGGRHSFGWGGNSL